MYKCRLKVIFAEKDIVQQEFAQKIGITSSALSGIVKGRTLPVFDTAYKISESLGIDIREIWIKVEEDTT